jgi:hypothetical protein
MTIARASVIRGPAIVTFGGVSMYTESDITLTPGITTQALSSSFFGAVDEIPLDAIVGVTFTPMGVWAYRTALLVNASRAIGSDIFGSDATCVIHALSGDKLTLKAAAITQMPQLRFAVGQQLYGPVTITGIRADNTAWATADSLVKSETASFADTSFSPADVLSQVYTMVWGSTAPWSAITSEVGLTIDFAMQLTPLSCDEVGTIGMTFGGISAVARFKALNATAANILDLLKLQGSGSGRGVRRSALKNELVITGTGVAFTLKNCHPAEGSVNFGTTTIRPGETAFTTTRSFTSGAIDALFTMGTGA